MKIIELEQGSPEWHEWRENGIGASDIAIILGSNPYKSTLTLWNEKCGYTANNIKNEAMLFGIKNEEKARSWVNENLGFQFSPLCGEDKEINYFRVSLDGWDKSTKNILEIKCPVSEKVLEKIREEKKYPEYWEDQIQWQLIVSKAMKAYLGVWDWKEQKTILIEVKPDVEKQAKMVKEGTAFWNMVVSGIAPEPSERDYVEIENYELEKIINEYKRADEEEKNSKIIKKGLKPEIEKHAKDYNIKAYGIKVKRCASRFSYDLEMMKEDGIDIEKYKVQKNGNVSYRIIVEKE